MNKNFYYRLLLLTSAIHFLNHQIYFTKLFYRFVKKFSRASIDNISIIKQQQSPHIDQITIGIKIEMFYLYIPDSLPP